MNGIGEGRVVTNRRQTPEEGIRLSLYSDVRQAGADPSGFLDALAYAVREEVWAKLKDEADRPLSFHRFIEAPYPVGIGSTVNVVAKLAQLPHRHEDGSAEKKAEMAQMRAQVLLLTNEIVAGQEIPERGTNQYAGGFGNTKPSRTKGLDRDYTLRRLKRDKRDDLLARINAREMSANAAAIEAGFRKRDTPLAALRRAWGKATLDERAAFRAEIEVD